MVPALFHNLRKAFLPLLHDATYDTMAKVVHDIENRSLQTRDRSQIKSSKRSAPITDYSSMEVCQTTNPEQPMKQPRTELGHDHNNSQDLHQTNFIDSNCIESGHCTPCYELM
jgi:hypothetical protein